MIAAWDRLGLQITRLHNPPSRGKPRRVLGVSNRDLAAGSAPTLLWIVKAKYAP